MAYEVLARKWRPGSFAAMAGQEHVLRALINALSSQRLHHAYLFTGTRGVGKTTVARILAKCLNCETGVTAEPCGVCSSCMEISEGRFVDLIEVDAASRSRVEETRELLENVQYAPTRGRFKVYLIDEVHMLSTASFNALLKTLEEPPPHVKFLLATTDPKKLPVTVLSRCLQFHLKNLTPERIVRHLEMVLAEEAVTAEPDALWALARAADGSMRDALSLTDQGIAFGDGSLLGQDVARMLGTIDQGALERILNALADGDGEALIACCADLAEHAADFPAVLRELMSALHRVAVVQAIPAVGPGADSGDTSNALVAAMAPRLTPEDVQLYYQIALTGQRDLPFAPDPRTGFEMTLLRMLAFRPEEAGSDAVVKAPPPTRAEPTSAPATRSTPLASAVETSSSSPAASSTASRSRVEPAPSAAVDPAAQPGTRTHARVEQAGEPVVDERPATAPRIPVLARPEDWYTVVGLLELEGVTGEFANHCLPERIDHDRVRLLLDPAGEALVSDVHVGRLEAGLSTLLARNIRVEIASGVSAEETPAQQSTRKRAERQRAAEHAIETDVNVRGLIEMFDASLQQGSIRPVG